MSRPARASEKVRKERKERTVKEVRTDPGSKGLGPRPAVRALDRRHIEELRLVGCTKADVVEIALDLVGPVQTRKLYEDLDSYGEWAVEDGG